MARTSLALESGVVNEASQLERGNNETNVGTWSRGKDFLIHPRLPADESALYTRKIVGNSVATSSGYSLVPRRKH